MDDGDAYGSEPTDEYLAKHAYEVILKEDIETMKAYLLLKFNEGDWHAVSDAANDLRVMEAKLQKDTK